VPDGAHLPEQRDFEFRYNAWPADPAPRDEDLVERLRGWVQPLIDEGHTLIASDIERAIRRLR
jgi:hypothetical protein